MKNEEEDKRRFITYCMAITNKYYSIPYVNDYYYA